MRARNARIAEPGGLLAQVTLVVAPVLAFRAVPVPGVALLAMTLPLLVLVIRYARTSGNRVPYWELAFVGVLALSVLWGDLPDYSTERLRTFLPVILATVVAAATLSGETVLRCLKLSFVILIGSSLIVIASRTSGSVRLGSPDVVVTAQYSKNIYGGLLVIALLLLLHAWRRSRLICALLLVVLIALNRSVTAWVVAIVLVVAMYACRWVMKRLEPSTARPVLIIGVLAFLGGVAVVLAAGLNSALATVGKDPTLGRRTEIWAASWEQIKEAPVLGHGAFTFLDTASQSPVTELISARFNNYQPPHPHNGFFDLAGQLGIVGVVVFMGVMIHAFRRGLKASFSHDSSALTGVLVLTFIVSFGFTEPTYLGSWLVITVMCVAIVDPRPGTRDGLGYVVRRVGASADSSSGPILRIAERGTAPGLVDTRGVGESGR